MDVENTPRVRRPDQAEALWQFLLYRRHYFAYEMALERSTSHERFLDIACGYGAALELVASKCDEVIAVDASQRALEALPALPNLQARCEDAANLSLPDDSVDVAVAFQLIEHVNVEVGKNVVREMRRVLKHGGRGYLTTPNARWRLLPGQRPWNPYHVQEYGPDSIREFCKEMGIPETHIHGVIGVGMAHEIERARVRPNVLGAYGGKPGRLASRMLKALNRFSASGRRARRRVTPEERDQEWFALTDDYMEGLDFWIEIHK